MTKQISESSKEHDLTLTRPSTKTTKKTTKASRAVRALLAFAAVTGAAGIGFGSAASAQTVRVQRPLTVLIGGRGDVGHGDIAYFYTGLSYALAKSSGASPAGGYTEYQVYADYAALLSFGGAGSGGEGGGRTTGPYDHSVGFGPAATFYFGPQIAPLHPFAGVGIGYYSEKVYDGSNVSRLGGKIRAGLELRGGFLGEVDYTYIGKAGGATTGRLGARVGYRF